ncbi:MAG: hypothetical protein LBJ00_07580 [Planctomycetaceae bacterium]|nr:hypothetical protein [Planctomycetaceae bacterium]
MKFPKRNTQAKQCEAVVQGRSLSPYRLRYRICVVCVLIFFKEVNYSSHSSLSKNLYLKIAIRVLMPSFQVIFFPDA